MTMEQYFSPDAVGASNPNQECRDYALDGTYTLVGLLDNPWYPPYVEDRRHYHNCMEIGICISGKGRIEMGRQEWNFADGTIVAVGRGLRHSQQNTGEPMTHWLYVLVDEQAVLREAPARHRAALQKLFDTAERRGLYFDSGDECRQMRFLVRAMFELYNRRGMVRMELEAMVQLLLAVMSRTQDSAAAGMSAEIKSRKVIEPALRFVSENYAQEIRMAEMAASCAMSESYFRKVFLSIMGMPPLEYLNRYRINRSIDLLRTTNETVLQIAIQTGFSSVATYNRNFHRYVGKSPAQWRKDAYL